MRYRQQNCSLCEKNRPWFCNDFRNSYFTYNQHAGTLIKDTAISRRYRRVLFYRSPPNFLNFAFYETFLRKQLYQSRFLILRLKQDAILIANPHIPVHRNMTAIPLPVPLPTIFPSNPAALPVEHINGSNT